MVGMLTGMPDTRQHWRARVHAYARSQLDVSYEEVKEKFPELKHYNNRKSAWSTLKSFMDSKWFKRTTMGRYNAQMVWHEARYYNPNDNRRRKDDIEYAICSLLQNHGRLTTDGIKEKIRLRSNREPHTTHISRLCQSCKFISNSGREWYFNYERTEYGV